MVHAKQFRLYCACITIYMYIYPFTCIQTSCNRFSGIPRYLHMVHAKQFCIYCAGITIYIYSFTCIQTSCNRFSGVPRSLLMVHVKQSCLYCACITIYIYPFTCACTNKLQQVLRNSKIPAHGPLNVILFTTQMQQVLRKVKTPDVVQPCKATVRVPRTCPGHQKEGHGSLPLE